MSKTVAVTDASFEADILKADRPVIVDFWAEWCDPCRRIAPALEEIAESMGDKITVAKVNVDENPEAPNKYNVRSIPTLIMFKDGEIISTQMGAVTKGRLEAWINENS